MKNMLCRGLFLLALISGALAADDILIADFESNSYGEWKTTGAAFGPGPAQGALPRQMKVAGYRGRGLVNSFYDGDRTTGTLTSPSFIIQRRNINFLIGGGQWPGKTCMNLVVDGKTVRSASGPNERPGGSEDLDWQQWDVSEWRGKVAVIEIVDRASHGWGHINVDQIVQSDKRLPAVQAGVTRTIKVEKRYLNLPIKNGAARRRMKFIVGGVAVRDFNIELADDTPDWWSFLEIEPFKGKQAVIEIDKLAEDSSALRAMEQADEIRDAENLYREPLRPQFHFSTRRGWINDPNGLVFSGGEYHLYYQLYPYGWRGGDKHWGHAVSSDLVRWRELPIALYPYAYMDQVYSGSAVVDKANSGGFKNGDADVIVAAYTSTARGECIVYSNDRGRTFREYEGNPVVTHTGRDPRLLWHGPTRKWVMAVYDEDRDMPRDPDPAADRKKRGGIAFYNSTDLKKWEFTSRIAGFYECPDMFELPVDGRKDATKWVLTAASSDYMLGQFDGRKFTPETPLLKGHLGAGFYAAQTFSDIPEVDGRRIQIGWGQVAAPGMPFNQMMNFPCELTLRTLPEGVRLCWQPVREIESLRGEKHVWNEIEVKNGDDPLAGIRGELFDVNVEFEPREAKDVTLKVRGVGLVYDAARQMLSCLGKSNPVKPVAGKVRLRLLVDRTSIEIFANEGSVFMPFPASFIAEAPALSLSAPGAKIRTLEVHELKSAWF